MRGGAFLLFTPIAGFNSLFRTAVVPAGNTYRRYPQAPFVYIDGGGQGAGLISPVIVIRYVCVWISRC